MTGPRTQDELLARSLGWLEGVCKRHASTRRDVDWRDLRNSAVVYFLDVAARGALASVPMDRVDGFVRKTLSYGVLHVLSERDRGKARTRRLDDLGPGSDDGRGEDPPELGHLPFQQLEERMAQELRERVTLDALEAIASPIRRFLVRAVYFRDHLQREHLQEAAAFRRGGARFVVRGVDQAWRMLEESRVEYERDAAGWRRSIAVAVCFRESPDAISDAALKKAALNIDQHLSRGVQELREHVRSTGDGEDWP